MPPKGTVERVIRHSNVHRAWHTVQRGEKDIRCRFVSEWDECRYVILAFDKNKDKKNQFLLRLDDGPDDVNPDGLPYLPTYDKMVSWDDHNNITIDGRHEYYNRRSRMSVFSDIRKLIAEVGLENIKRQINELITTGPINPTNHDASVHPNRSNQFIGQEEQPTDSRDACVQSNDHTQQPDNLPDDIGVSGRSDHTDHSDDHSDSSDHPRQKKRRVDFDLVAHARKYLRQCKLMVEEEERSKERIRKLQEEEDRLKECIRKIHVVMDNLESVIRS
eukprot:GILJ01016562.1.p2 GENE.GILJ01016562.1~~GILJ01016562.1.p2  ORF type:complete len:275 (+),score=37.10 GILJ01016562.1:36-860(+)